MRWPAVPTGRLSLPQVTLCAVTSVNVDATVDAMRACMAEVEFGACLLLTNADPDLADAGIEVRRIDPIRSASAYSDLLLTRLVEHVATSHVLIVQWDGYILDVSKWRDSFLEFDYIGARWPQFADGYDVGNGGFSLRSRRLLALCADRDFVCLHPEDTAIGRLNRPWLESRGIRIAPGALADVFSVERTGALGEAFGFHGVFNMPLALGADRFWAVYTSLDHKGPVWHDFWPILAQLAFKRGGLRRAARFCLDRLQDGIASRRARRNQITIASTGALPSIEKGN